jgi:hypothetical protein
MIQYLVVAARNHTDLYGYLRGQFGGDDNVQVLLDRRFDGRRRRQEVHRPDRRRADRRNVRGREDELYCHGFFVIRKFSALQWRPPWWGSETPEETASLDQQQRLDETKALHSRERVAGWIAEGQRLLALVPKLLREHEHLAARAEAAERKSERFEEEVRRLRNENEHFRRERRQAVETLKTLTKNLHESGEGTP